jgi:ferredoxin
MINEIQMLAERYDLAFSSELFTSESKTLDPEKENAFEVELMDTGKTYSVPRDKTLLEVLLNNDIDVPNDCAEGLCGSCEVLVVEGDEIDHRDHVLSAKEKQSNQKMMTCCSRASGKITIKL